MGNPINWAAVSEWACRGAAVTLGVIAAASLCASLLRALFRYVTR